MKIAIFEIEDWERDRFKELEPDHDLVLVEEPLKADNADSYSDAQVISTFINSKLNRETLSRLGALKMIATRSTGFDHIDLSRCREKEVTVSNVPEYGDYTVAEHVFGLLLTISHRLYEAVDRTRKGDFSPRGLQGFDLRGKTLGVVGTGSIGLRVLEISRGFGMKGQAFDVRPDHEAARQLDFKYLDMDELLGTSDVITLHVPANEKTRHLISDKEFGKMKKGAVLINTSRGEVVEVQALLQALTDETLQAAGLDVLSEEPAIREEAELLRSVFQKKHNLENLLADHILLRMRNVIITPHSAFNTREALERIIDTTIGNIQGFVSGEPQNIVS